MDELDQYDEQENEALRERMRAATELVEKAALGCGLYLERADVGLTAGGHPVLVTQLRVGELAFTSRVLDPEAEDVNRAVREIEVDTRLDEFNRIARQAKEGSGPLAALADDEEEA